VPAISTKDKASTISTAGTALYPADFQCCYLFVTTVEAPAILRSDNYLLLIAEVLINHHYCHSSSTTYY
jgi:hypothetical protein